MPTFPSHPESHTHTRFRWWSSCRSIRSKLNKYKSEHDGGVGAGSILADHGLCGWKESCYGAAPPKKERFPETAHTHRVASMARRMRRAYLYEKGRHLNEATNRRHHRRHQPVMLHSLHMLNIIEFSHILMCCFSVALAVFVWVSYEGIDKIWNVLILKEFETIFEYR